MAVRTRANYKSTKNSLITTNGVGAVSGADVNNVFEDTADSVLFLEDHINYKEVTIPTASVLTANGTPVELVAAAGATKGIVLMGLTMSIDYNSVPYATNTTILIRRGATTLVSVSGFLNASADAINNQGAISGAVVLNANLNFMVDVGNPTAGNSDVKVKVFYKIVDVTA
jgi:hypothetical protein